MSEVNQDSKIPYEDEINSFLTERYRESWMDDSDWKTFLDILETKSGISVRSLSDDVQTGIKNGYSVQSQFDLIRTLIPKNL